MDSNAETVDELRKHVNTLKDAVLDPIREYAYTDAGTVTMPPELDRTVRMLISYVTFIVPSCSHLISSSLQRTL